VPFNSVNWLYGRHSVRRLLAIATCRQTAVWPLCVQRLLPRGAEQPVPAAKTLTCTYSPHFRRKSLWVSVGSGAVRGESVLVGGLKGCYWSNTVWRIRELHCYIQTENIKQLRVACSECTCTVNCGCCDNVLHWITLNSSELMKAYCLLFVQWLWKKCFQDG
jgi:hypothetical protein